MTGIFDLLTSSEFVSRGVVVAGATVLGFLAAQSCISSDWYKELHHNKLVPCHVIQVVAWIVVGFLFVWAWYLALKSGAVSEQSFVDLIFSVALCCLLVTQLVFYSFQSLQHAQWMSLVGMLPFLYLSYYLYSVSNWGVALSATLPILIWLAVVCGSYYATTDNSPQLRVGASLHRFKLLDRRLKTAPELDASMFVADEPAPIPDL